jgi:PKD repeat protein
MKQKAVSGIILTLLLVGILFLASTTQNVKADGSWIWVRNIIVGYYGEAVVGTDTALCIARGTVFYRYLPSDSSWTPMEPPPNPDAGDAFKTGTALAWDFGDYIYALYGAATPDSRKWFYRYSISQDSWQPLANTMVDQGEGDAITWVGVDNCIYATVGGEQRSTHFMRYDPSTNSWNDVPADPPAGMGDGASLVWTGDNYLYALRGEFDENLPLYDFWRYSLLDDVWTAKANIPATAHDSGVGGVGDGGSLLYVGFWLANQTDYLYALSGNQAYPELPQPIPDNRFYRYTISTDSWEHMENLPFGVGDYVGCRLGYADGYIYAWQGTPGTWAGGGDDLARYEFPPPSPPVADFDYSPTSPSVNETVTFNASDSYDPDGTIINYTWNFGDTTVVTATEPIVTHGYKNAGSYEVNLTVADNDGLIDITINSISIKKLSSAVTINVHPIAVIVDSNITVEGTITPIRYNTNVTISYRSFSTLTWNVLATVKTNSTGNYSYIWKTNETGTYYVKASWLGDANTLPAESGTKSVTINPIDSTPPTTTDDYDGLWYCNDFTITLVATDDLSGVAETYYRINEGLIENVSTHGQPILTTENTNNTLEYWSVDNAGIEEIPHKILTGIKLDKTVPDGSIVINNNDAYTNSISITLTLTAMDATSGVYQVRYSNEGVWDTELWEIPSATKGWTLTLGDGTKTVYYQVKDYAGLISETYSDTIILDATEPTIRTPSRTPEGNPQPNQDVKVSANITDATSEVKNATLFYTVNNGTSWEDRTMNHNSSTGLYEATILGQSAGTLVRYKIVAYDYAGNNATLNGTGPYCTYQVVPEFSSTIILPLFIALSLITIIFTRKKLLRKLKN